MTNLSRPWQGIQSLPGAAQRVLLHSLLFGFALSVSELLFNFYLVSLGYGAEIAGLFSTVMRLAGVLLGVPGGMLIDRLGPRRALIGAMAVYAASWATMISFGALWVLLVAQLWVGAAFTVAMAAVVTLLASAVGDADRARVFGLNASATLIIGWLGNLLGGLLPTMAALLLQSDPQSVGAYRVALVSVSLLALLAMIPLLRLSLPAPNATTVTVGGALSRPRRRMTISEMLRMSIGSLFLGAGGGFILPFQNLYLRQAFGLSDGTVGVVLGWIALAMGLGALLGAPASRLVGLQRATALLRLLSLPAMLLMAFAPVLAVALAGLTLRGVAVCSSYPLYDTLVMEATPPRQRGMSAAILNVTWALGWAICAAVSGYLQIYWGFMPVLLLSAMCYGCSAWAIASMRIQRL